MAEEAAAALDATDKDVSIGGAGLAATVLAAFDDLAFEEHVVLGHGRSA